ncbi:berberine bridge enzyme-like Cyn d 4 [Oryza brachyantha]|uniref:berberine bridge enzyme-like Cyn d 4 n=1 Tax=Oryza brachyantha TaxID=4533 RepID=UPI001ADBDD06|nr:berberine bridge enzyme-like Cyn d 4 [Oryza brachyantha]
MAATTMILLLLYCCFCNVFFLPSSAASSDDFLQCLTRSIPAEQVYTQSSSAFMSVLTSSVQNPEFVTNATVRPLCIIAASGVSHVQAAVRCGRRNGVRLRVRSGGHDYEGLSYRSVRAEVFAVLDLARMRAVRVRAGDATAWVDSGATLGELYYAIGTVNPGFAFPGGACSTVGVGGYLSGGGIGLMMRKFGIGADNVLDAMIVNADGELLDRGRMGEDLFWAIRGGGGESFGVVVSWRLKLSMVPSTVTVFNIAKTTDNGAAAAALAKWETLVLEPFLPELTIRVVLQGRTALFQSLYLGGCSRLAATMRAYFPELGMTAADCHELTWLRAMAFISLGSADAAPEGMLRRTNNLGTYVKSKSDYVRRPMGAAAWDALFSRWLAGNGNGILILEPHGGVVGSVVPDFVTPYPHRAGVLYNIQYGVFWWGDADGAAARRWLEALYAAMEAAVSSNPREAFANYRDLDIGENVVGGDGVTTYESARAWGERYFMGNFRRLAAVKGKVDPGDYFRNEQSIPPLLLPY